MKGLGWIVATLLALALLEHAGDPRRPLLIDHGHVRPADYQACATVRTAPLLRSPRGRLDYRADPDAFNDRGDT